MQQCGKFVLKHLIWETILMCKQARSGLLFLFCSKILTTRCFPESLHFEADHNSFFILLLVLTRSAFSRLPVCFCSRRHLLLISQIKRSCSVEDDKDTAENQECWGVITQSRSRRRCYGWVEDKCRKHCASAELGWAQPLRNWNSFWPLIELRYVSSLHCISPLCVSVCLTLFQLYIKKAICSKKASQHTMCSRLIHKFPLPSIQTRHCPPSHQFYSLI